MDKKGNLVTDLFVWIIVIFSFGIFCVMIVFMGNEVYGAFIDNAHVYTTDTINGTELVEQSIGYLPTGYSSLKWLSYTLIIGLGISIVLGNFLVRVHPVMVIPYIIILGIAVVLSIPLSNTYEILLGDTLLGPSFSGFFGQSYIFLYLPIWVLVFGILGGIAMFVNLPRDSETGGGDMF